MHCIYDRAVSSLSLSEHALYPSNYAKPLSLSTLVSAVQRQQLAADFGDPSCIWGMTEGLGLHALDFRLPAT